MGGDSTKKRFPRRPPRLQLFANVRPFYFVTFNTAQRKRVLDNSDIHQGFLDYPERGFESHGVAVGRYVIMPDHVHLFVSFSERGTTLQNWTKGLKTILGKRLAENRIPRPHWQPGFFDHVLRSGESYGEKWQYVSMNPVRAGLCAKPEDWPWQGEVIRLSF
ncbi:MAG TPA: transposase [Opitutales bacterium]|nr:transposase [Opitutales bacterium]